MAALLILRRMERVFLVTVFLAMVVLFFLNVVSREIGGTIASQLAWIEEAVRFLNIFLVFGALGLALEKGRHVGIDTIRKKLPGQSRIWAQRLIDAAGCLFTAYMTYLAYQLVAFVLGTGQRSATLDIPMGWVYVAPVAGFGLLSLRYMLSLMGTIDRFGLSGEEDKELSREGTI
jgi:TRAP-type transport system small permease protein